MIVTLAFALLAGLLLVGTARRRDVGRAVGSLSRETLRRDRMRTVQTTSIVASSRHPGLAGADAVEAQPAFPGRIARHGHDVWVPPSDESLGVTRRMFLNRSIVNLTSISLVGFGAAALAFLWPGSSAGFGSKIRVGKLADVEARVADGQGFAYYPEGRMWITTYPAAALEKARATYDPAVVEGMERGVVALYQKCPHLGCRVPECVTSQWFECPCHGSQYNRVGEKKAGPAPRGMDRFPVEFSGEVLSVDTGTIILGPPIGTNTTGQEAEGPHCVNEAQE